MNQKTKIDLLLSGKIDLGVKIIRGDSMKSSKLVELLSTMQKEELRKFKKQIRTRYSKHKSSIILYEHLEKYHPTYEDVRVNKEYISKHKLKGYTDKRIANEAHQVSKWLEEFLVEQKLASEEGQLVYKRLLADIYEERDLLPKKISILEEMEEALEAKSKNQFDYSDLVKVSQELYYDKYQVNHKISLPDLSNALQHLKVFETVSRLQYSCEYFFAKNIFRLNENEILPVLNQEIINALPIVKMYDLLFNALNTNKYEDYLLARDYLFENYASLGEDCRNQSFSYLTNIAGFAILNKSDYSKELFTLYQKGLSMKLLIDKGSMLTTNFNNIVSVAISRKKYEWAEGFVNTYSEYLNDKNRLETTNLAKAIIFFGQKKYEEALDILNIRGRMNGMNELRARMLLICCLIGLNMDRIVIWNKIYAFDKLLSRNSKIDGHLLQAMRNSLFFIRKILDEKVSKTVILAKLEEKKNVYFRYWISEQLETYKAKY